MTSSKIIIHLSHASTIAHAPSSNRANDIHTLCQAIKGECRYSARLTVHFKLCSHGHARVNSTMHMFAVRVRRAVANKIYGHAFA